MPSHMMMQAMANGSSESLIERLFTPPGRRHSDEEGGTFTESVLFGCYDYSFRGTEFLVYIAEGGDGMLSRSYKNYILVPPGQDDEALGSKWKASAQNKTDELIAEASKWFQELHEEVLVFDNGYWQKNKDLWRNVQKSNWEDVILEQDKKKGIINDVKSFFDGEAKYREFGVPWKNGKTISTKALMHDISKRTNPGVDSLSVKTFNAMGGPQAGIRLVFLKARQMAPCLLIFEDIDSLVTPMIRSYFLHEVDGLESNHGILMIGSTNHLEMLDPGLSKRPSRFDRKYKFDDPNKQERLQYCEYWRNKLKNNKKIDFPKEISVRAAEITEDFSFAYIKEAFVATLLVIVAKSDEQCLSSQTDDDLQYNDFWMELKNQIESLRKELEAEGTNKGSVKRRVQPLT